MERAVTYITLDVQKIDSGQQITAKRGDSARRLVVSLANRGRPYISGEGVTAVFYERKPDGNPCFNDCDIDGCTVTYDFTGQTTNVVGLAVCEIRLYDAGGQLLTSPGFEMLVDDTEYQEGDVPDSSPEFTALTEMVSKGTELIRDLTDVQAGLEPIRDAAIEAAERAETAAGDSETAAADAEKAANEAKGAAAAAGTQAGQATKARNEAVTAQGAAEQAAQQAAGHSNTALENARSAGAAAEDAATQAETAGNYAENSRTAAEEAKEAAQEAKDARLYYTPVVTQPTTDTMKVEFAPSKAGMAAVEPVTVKLPSGGSDGGENVELDTTLTQSGKAADAKSVGDKIAEITGVSLVEPAYEDRPKLFFGAPLQQTKDEIVTTFSYRSKTLSFDCYAEIKAQGNSTLQWPKKNQTVKLYVDAACTEKFKIDFKGWGKQNKFVLKAYWRDLTHVRDIVSVRLEGDCLRTNPDYDGFPELLKTTPNLGGIDGFPVVVYAAGVYQGRYMLNIPKDKWMYNMDDDLDEHCVLCSENYKSGCFRAAAKIDESDWTDEIHDTVPGIIKTRWNEVIGFVMNSTDEEFVANLDSHIKVSTLIDRHLMGLLSCDYDGYGKNQIYITYDGQQWYANRYDKDGTWGAYWTGNNMLPSNYGREQYEDFTSSDSDGSGNLLFIRLEQVFWKRLQDRWDYLKVNELSIPNIINRFRELYDITPPYVIEGDYASTTANGKFTEIPNKTTCTIQQIEKFVVERHAWMDEYMASLTPEIPVPCTGITLDKTELSFTAAGTQTLTAIVEPENTTDSVVWSSDDASIATVSSGVVRAKANGSCIIKAKCGEYSASCAVYVSGLNVFNVTNNLTNVTTDNESTTAAENSSYTANLSGVDNFTIDTVIVTMGGVNITDTVYNNGVISISSVTGDIVITATGKEREPLTASLENGTATVGNATVAVTNGNHVKIVGGQEVFLPLSKISKVDGKTMNEARALTAYAETSYTLKSGDVVRVAKKNVTLTNTNTGQAVTSSEMAALNIITASGELKLGADHKVTDEMDYTITLTADYAVDGFVFWCRNIASGTTLEFDVEMNVNGERYC